MSAVQFYALKDSELCDGNDFSVNASAQPFILEMNA